jgi:hypothetical protein
MLTSLVIIARQPALSFHFGIWPAFSPALRVSFRTFGHSAAPTKPSPSIVSALFPSARMGSTPWECGSSLPLFPQPPTPPVARPLPIPGRPQVPGARRFLAFPRPAPPANGRSSRTFCCTSLQFFALFCTAQNLIPFSFNTFRTFCRKTPGGGYLPTAIKRYAPRRGTSRAARGICFSLRSPLATRHSPLLLRHLER